MRLCLIASRNVFMTIFLQVARFFFLGLLILLSGCSNLPYRGKDVLGADEFVMDSYKIKEGKFSILEMMQGEEIEPLPPEFLEPYTDVVHEGDLLRIVLFHPTRTDLVAACSSVNREMGFFVQQGKVLLPNLNPIVIENLTLDEARIKIQSAYEEQIQDVQVFLAFQDRSQRKVELAGQVHTPIIPVDGKVRLFELLALARIPSNANLFKSYMIRDQKMVPVDFCRLLKNGDMSQNVVMRGGDKIYIADALDSSIMVLGEVGKECVIAAPSGFITLRKALAEAGGIPYTGDKSYIQVIRGSILHPKIYTINWQHVIHLPNDSLLLIPGDIVYVAAKPLTEWNRFVTQILPTLIGFDLLTKGAKSIGVNVP
jgi:polysaccharide biosynthesis/export protein